MITTRKKFCRIYIVIWNFNVFSYEHKCSPENSEKPSLAFRFISVIYEILFFVILSNNSDIYFNLSLTISTCSLYLFL